MRWCIVPIVAGGCGFSVAATPAADGAVDAPPPALCAADPELRLCFSFDQPVLPTQLPNEGVAAVAATLTDVTRTPRPPVGGAALLGATSSIYVPMTPEISNILAIEVWFRIDTMPADLGRSGLVDSNVIPPNISLFFYRQDPGRTVRCGIGGQLEVFDAPQLATDRWHYVACTCDGTTLAVFLDGAPIGERAGNCGTAGALVGDGLTIGSDNTGNPTMVGARLGGAIDGIRLWSTGLTAAQVCERAGGVAC